MACGSLLVAVIDGQGGGVGKAFIERLHCVAPDVYVRALGTNSVATSVMLRAGASDGATGENSVVFNARLADVIVGPIGVVMPNGLLGEVSPSMASAVGESRAVKVLIPSNKCSLMLAGLAELPFAKLIESAVGLTLEALKR
ncbi:MAG: DUF3842 family protein [Synergistaceae bacterium]